VGVGRLILFDCGTKSRCGDETAGDHPGEASERAAERGADAAPAGRGQGCCGLGGRRLVHGRGECGWEQLGVSVVWLWLIPLGTASTQLLVMRVRLCDLKNF
jgi:hypothetical protein